MPSSWGSANSSECLEVPRNGLGSGSKGRETTDRPRGGRMTDREVDNKRDPINQEEESERQRETAASRGEHLMAPQLRH